MSATPSDSPKITLRGLDGVRALAALGVLASHTIGSSVRFGLGASRGIQLANEGVTIFFTLSGFLITYLLLEERRRFDRVVDTVAIRRLSVRLRAEDSDVERCSGETRGNQAQNEGAGCQPVFTHG